MTDLHPVATHEHRVHMIRANRALHRIGKHQCNVCEQVKDWTAEYYPVYKLATGRLYGVCKVCWRGHDTRTTADQKRAKLARVLRQQSL